MNGCIVQSNCGPAGSAVGQMERPYRMAVDKDGHVMVTDDRNGRVELFSPTLTHLGYLQIPGYSLIDPWAIYLDELTHRLYIGELAKGRLFVLSLNIADVIVKEKATDCTIS